MQKRERKLFSDALKLAIPAIVPLMVKEVLGLVPPGSKIDHVLDKFQEHSGKIISTVSAAILTLTNAPEFFDDIVASLNTEVIKELKKRYSEDGEKKSLIKKAGFVDKGISLGKAAMLIPGKESAVLLKLINSDELSKEQRSNLFDFVVSSEKTEAKEIALNLSALRKIQFLAWAELVSPKKEPIKETELEKQIKEGLEEFKADAKNYFQRDSYFVRLAKQKGLM